MNNPLISVVTVSYNAVTTIEHTILSVINQTYPNIEYIIIDGGSTDGTVDIIKKYADRIAYWVSEPDKGIYDAMNKGIKVATGLYTNFMNAGDSFYAEQTVAEVAIYMKREKPNIIYGDVNCMYSWGNKIAKPLPLEQLLRKNLVFSHQACFVTSALIKQQPFEMKYKIASDYNFFYHQYIAGKTFCYIPVCIANFDSVSGISTRQIVKALKEDAIINGNIKKTSWRIFYAVLRFDIWLRTFIASILPKQFVLKIKKYKNR